MDESYFLDMPNPILADRRSQLVLFMVDTSVKMAADDRIDKVNEAIEMIVRALKIQQNKAVDAITIYIAILEFNQEAHWLVDPTPISDYDYRPVPCSDRARCFGRAIREVNSQLSRSKKLLSQFRGKIVVPFLFLVTTDGYPSPDDDFDSAMDEIEKNGWFINSLRYAVVIADESTGNSSAHRAAARFTINEQDGVIGFDEVGERSAAFLRMYDDFVHPIQPLGIPYRRHGDQSQPSSGSDPTNDSIGFGAGIQPDPFASPFPEDDPFAGMFPGNFN